MRWTSEIDSEAEEEERPSFGCESAFESFRNFFASAFRGESTWYVVVELQETICSYLL